MTLHVMLCVTLSNAVCAAVCVPKILKNFKILPVYVFATKNLVIHVIIPISVEGWKSCLNCHHPQKGKNLRFRFLNHMVKFTMKIDNEKFD